MVALHLLLAFAVGLALLYARQAAPPFVDLLPSRSRLRGARAFFVAVPVMWPYVVSLANVYSRGTPALARIVTYVAIQLVCAAAMILFIITKYADQSNFYELQFGAAAHALMLLSAGYLLRD